MRDRVNRYFYGALGDKSTRKDVDAARELTLRSFPELLDVYIRLKEESGDAAVAVSKEESEKLREVFVVLFSELVNGFWAESEMRDRPPVNSFEEAKFRCDVFKRWVEDKDGWRNLNHTHGRASESEVQRLIFLALQVTDFDVNREVNNGRGPIDFKLSAGANDASLIEVKLASNTALERNLERQVEIYKRANQTKYAVKVIVYYTEAEQVKVQRILKRLEPKDNEWLVLIDARNDNKPSGSKA